MPDARRNDAAAAKTLERTPAATDMLTWVQERWVRIAGLLLVLLVLWLFSGRRLDENGRYVLVKDDVPCQGVREDDDARRWCYLVLDTRTGNLEERARKVGSRGRR